MLAIKWTCHIHNNKITTYLRNGKLTILGELYQSINSFKNNITLKIRICEILSRYIETCIFWEKDVI